jgi:hypothetical protein
LFPGTHITNTPQVGLTDVTQYEHRVGRTGRAGKTGEALLLLANDESRLLSSLAGMSQMWFGLAFITLYFGAAVRDGPLMVMLWLPHSSSLPVAGQLDCAQCV